MGRWSLGCAGRMWRCPGGGLIRAESGTALGSSDSCGEAGRGRVTEGTLWCWDCDILLCRSGVTSLALLGLTLAPPLSPTMEGPIPRLCPGCLEERRPLWGGLGLLSPSCRWRIWEFFCLTNSIYFFPTQMSFPPCQGSI